MAEQGPVREVEVKLQAGAPNDQAILIVPRPFDHWDIRFDSCSFKGVRQVDEITGVNTRQRAFILHPANPFQPPELTFRFRQGEFPASSWVWEKQTNQYTKPSEHLVEMARSLTRGTATDREKIRCLVDHAAGSFQYSHPEKHFGEGEESVPALDKPTRGSCIDINTFLLASSRALGVKSQYIAGYWFHPEKVETLDMHCWLAFDADGEVLFWDVAHHIKWGVEKLAPGLNPAGGRRVPMSCGRGLEFDTPYGRVSISHFSEPVWVLPDGEKNEPEIVAHVKDEIFQNISG